MNRETAELLVRTVQRHYGEDPKLNTEMRVKYIDGEWMVVTAFETYYRVPFRMPLTSRPCRCTAPHCVKGKVSPALLDKIRPEDPREGLCSGGKNTCPNRAEHFTTPDRSGPDGSYGLCTGHHLLRHLPA